MPENYMPRSILAGTDKAPAAQEAEEPKAPRHVAATKKNELAQAASIPLPEEPIAEQEVEEEEEDEEQDFQAAPAKPTSPAAAKAHVEPAEYVKPEEYVEAADAGQPPSKVCLPLVARQYCPALLPVNVLAN